MSWLRWTDGRQNGGYSRMLLLKSEWFLCDLYLLRLPKTSLVPHHTDQVYDGYEHHRVNIVLREAKSGGKTFISRSLSGNGNEHETRRAYHFRPDIQEHFVTPVMKGSILILSFGWLKRRSS